jgi:predicted GNAT family acetyltransferase
MGRRLSPDQSQKINRLSTGQILAKDRRRFCFLFTDAGNPTSNAIYQRIGYIPAAEVQEYRFEVTRGGADE